MTALPSLASLSMRAASTDAPAAKTHIIDLDEDVLASILEQVAGFADEDSLPACADILKGLRYFDENERSHAALEKAMNRWVEELSLRKREPYGPWTDKVTFGALTALEDGGGASFKMSALEIMRLWCELRNQAGYGGLMKHRPSAMRIVKSLVSKNSVYYALQMAPESLRNDKELVLAAVKRNAEALKLASADLRNTPEVVLAAVKQDGSALLWASAEMGNIREVVMAAVKQYGNALMDASADLKNTLEVVLAAVKQDGKALLWASDNMKNNREVVMAAVKQNGRAIGFASAELRNDPEINEAAVNQLIRPLSYYDFGEP